MAGKRDNLRLQLVVRDRSDIQQLALELLFLLENRQDAAVPGPSARNPYDLLVGVTFALWRAVFLVESETDWDARLGNAESFLEKVIRDNAIGYADDWNNRRWSFAFYADNARYRLLEFAELVPKFKTQIRKRKSSRAFAKPLMRSNPHEHWRNLCEALRDAIYLLKQQTAGGTA